MSLLLVLLEILQKGIVKQGNQLIILWFIYVFLFIFDYLFLIVATLIRKAQGLENFHEMKFNSDDDIWKLLMLEPQDYSQKAIHNPKTKALMEKITFDHGGEEFDKRYPLGIPT